MFWTIIYWIFMAVCGFVIGYGCQSVSEASSEVNDPHLSETLQTYARDRLYKWLIIICAAIVLAGAASTADVGRELDKEIKSLQERVQTLEEQAQKHNTNTYNI